MLCPRTPQPSRPQQFASSACSTQNTGTLKRRKLTAHHPDCSPSSGRGLENGPATTCDSLSRDITAQRRSPGLPAPPTKNFSRRFNQQLHSDDIFERDTKSSAAVLQFRDAARRLALSPLSHNAQNRGPPAKARHAELRSSRNSVSADDTCLGNHRELRAHDSDPEAYFERDITSARRRLFTQQYRPLRSSLASVCSPIPINYGSPSVLNPRRDQRHPYKISRKPRNYSRPIRAQRPASVKRPVPNFSRSVHPFQPLGILSSELSTRLNRTENVSLPPMPQQNGGCPDNASIRSTSTVPGSEAGDSISSIRTSSAPHDETAQIERQISETVSAHSSSCESFDSAVSDCLGDKRLQLSNWEIWMQRLGLSLFVFTVNLALVFTYLKSSKHPYLLAILIFMKSKDVLSTMTDITGILRDSLRRLIWPPRQPDPRWILSLVCAYAETEEQILKTVYSMARGSTHPHKQAICIILDGKPRDILGKMSTVKITVQRPYTTWRGIRGEITVSAGYLESIPLILVVKAKNAGKKDSLILGHDLFNHPRKDMPYSTQMLRREIWQTVLPAIIQKSKPVFEKFDFVFCTDADSTIHDQALRRLADALCEEDNAMAACGVLFAEFGDWRTEYSPWHLFQQFQYTFGQYVRRQAESTWGRVTCLPGCITMIVVRPEMGPAISEYAKPVTGHNLFRHQVQYLGTDRRLTWCMMSQGKHLRTIFVPDALSETVVPDGISHYLSQRRRWASNAFFNDFFYVLGPRQRLITRLFAAINIIRLTFVYYRIFNTGFFLHGLLTNFYVVKIIPTLIVSKTPAMWYLLLVSIREPLLRKRLHKILLGLCVNQVISPILSVIVFTNVLFHMGSQAWGKTGASTLGTVPVIEIAPVLGLDAPPSQGWTPRRLANSVRTAIRGVSPKSLPKSAQITPLALQHGITTQTSGQGATRESHDKSSQSHPSANNASDTSTTNTSITQLMRRAQSDAIPVLCTPVSKSRSDSLSANSVLTRRTPHHQRRAPLNLNKTNRTPVRMTDDSTSGLSYEEG